MFDSTQMLPGVFSVSKAVDRPGAALNAVKAFPIVGIGAWRRELSQLLRWVGQRLKRWGKIGPSFPNRLKEFLVDPATQIPFPGEQPGRIDEWSLWCERLKIKFLQDGFDEPCSRAERLGYPRDVDLIHQRSEERRVG